MAKKINIILLLILTTSLSAKTIEVCQDCAFKSIKQALNHSQAGDEIWVGAGIYYESQIIIDKPVHLKGRGLPIIDAQGEGEIITITADSITFEGFQLQNVGTSYLSDWAGIRVKKSRHFLIRNNVLKNCFFGIYLEHADEGEISCNEIVGEAKNEMSSGNAIHLWYCNKILVENNQVSHHRDGIYFEFVDDSQIKYNISEDNIRYGLHFMFSNRDDYYKNQFRRNGAGVAVMFSKFINMWENEFDHNWGRASYGLLLKEIYDAEIHNNSFTENSIGIYVEGSTRVNYLKNDFIQNGWAIKISGGCLDNRINQNNFLANTFDLSMQSAAGSNSFDGNYWSDYNGYDLDKNGIGDIPYRPVKLYNYLVNRSPETLVLLRSFFIELINFSEKVSPAFTPEAIKDQSPSMRYLKRKL